MIIYGCKMPDSFFAPSTPYIYVIRGVCEPNKYSVAILMHD